MESLRARRLREIGCTFLLLCFPLIYGGRLIVGLGCNEVMCPDQQLVNKKVEGISRVQTFLGDAPLIQFDSCSVALWYYAGEFRTTDSLIAFGKDHFPIGSNVNIVAGGAIDKTICYLPNYSWSIIGIVIMAFGVIILCLICLPVK